MGLPQLDFRVPEATWFKSALSSRFGAMPGLSSTGALAWPYKIAAVAVMALVACGTLVTFGSAQAETPASAEVAALPGTDEARPSVEGQVLPPASTNPALLNANDLLSSLNLTDYSPGDTTLSLTDDEDDDDSDDSDDNGDDDTKSDTKKKSSSTKSGSGTTGTGSGGSTDEQNDDEPVEGPKHKAWVQANAEYEDAKEEYEDAKDALSDWEDENETYQDCRKNPLKYIGKNCDKDYNPGPKPSVPPEPQSPGSEPDFED